MNYEQYKSLIAARIVCKHAKKQAEVALKDAISTSRQATNIKRCIRVQQVALEGLDELIEFWESNNKERILV